METPGIQKAEEQHLRELRALGVLDISKEKPFDDLARLLALTCGTEFAAITFVDRGRICFKALEGNPGNSEIPVCESFTRVAVQKSEVTEVADLRIDSRFANDPVVNDSSMLRFYAGVPLALSSGAVVGTACAFGCQPKTLNSSQREQLILLANQVVSLIESRFNALLERSDKSPAKETVDRARLLRKVAEITRNAVIVTGVEGRIEWVNTGFQKVTGYLLDEVVGRRPGEFLQGHGTSSAAVRTIAESLRAGRGVSQEILNYSKDGAEYWIDLDIQPVFDEQGILQNFVAVQTNITSLKKQEEALRLARDEAQRASRLKSRFVANVSHELRTPLNGILGMSEYLRHSVPEAFAEDINTLHCSGEHLLNILNELIDVASIEAGALNLKSEPFRLLDLLHETTSIFEPSASKKGLELALSASGVDEDLWIEGDPTRLRQVLMNLIGNAIKFTERGSVTLHCLTDKASAPDGNVNVRFSVQDTGPGIKESDHERIFQHFERIDSAAPGAGLGLAISREILNRMNSRLTLASVVGQGSRFSFDVHFPQKTTAQPHALEYVEQTLSESEHRHIGCEILVIDDDPVNLKVMQKLLSKLGVSDVRLCRSGATALEEWKGLRPDIVLVDIRMPDMDGYTFLERYKQQENFSDDSPLIVACSASSSQSDEANFLAAGFDRFLAKPVDIASLTSMLNARKIDNVDSDAPESGLVETVITGSLKSKMANNDDLIYIFLKQLEQSNEKRWADIDAALASDNVKQIANSVHTLKGQLGYFGDENNAYQAACSADRALKSDNCTVPGELVEELRLQMQQLMAAVHQVLAKKY